MAEETIDKLKVEIEAESKDAGQSLDNFTTILGKMKNVLEGMKVENLSSLKSSLKELGSFKFTGSINEMEKLNKQMNDLTTKTAKKMSSDLINSFTVTDKNVQASIESICEAFVKFNKVAMMEDYSPDSMANYRKSLQELTDVVTKNARELDASVAAAERYKEFYDYFRSAGPLMVSREQIAGMNPDEWEYYRKAFPGELTVDTTKAKEELDSFYSDVSEQGSGVFQDLFQGFDYSSAASDQLAQIKSITDEYAKALEGIPYSAEDQKEIIRPDVLSTLGDYVNNYEKQMEEIAGDKSVSEILKFDEENTDISGLKDAVDVLRQLNSVLKNPSDSNSLETTAANIKNLCDAAKGAADIKTLAEGLSSLFAVIQNVPKSDTFKTVAHDLGTLSDIDASNLSDIGTALGSIAQAVSGTENMSTFASSLANVAETVSEIGDVSGLESSAENISEMGEVSKEAGESMQQASKDISTFRDIVENPIEAGDTSLDSTVDSLAQSASEMTESLDGVSDEFGGLFKNNSAAIEETRDNLGDVISSINEYRTLVNGMETNKIPLNTEAYEDAKASLSGLTRLLDQYKRSLTKSLDISEGPGRFLAESSDEGDNALQNLLATIREYKATVSGMESGRMIFNEEDYTEAVQGLAQANAELKAFKASFSDTSVESEKLDKEIEKTTQSLNDLVDKEERFNATGGNTQSSQYKELQYDIEKAKNKLQELINKQQEMSGESVSSAGLDSYEKIAQEGALAINRATAAMQNFSKVSENGSSSSSKFGSTLSGIVNSGLNTFTSIASKAHSIINSLGSALGRVGSAATSAVKGLSKMVAEAMGLNKLPSLIKKVNSSMDTLNSKITRFTRLFTMMGVRKAYTAIFNDLGEAFEHLAQKSDSVNAHISTLMSAMSQMSHSVAALASPLLDIFGPALTYIINLLNTAINAVNQFLAAITGKTYYSAKNVATDYAESLEDAASSAGSASAAQDKLNKQLQSFDELNNLTTSQSSGSGGGSGSGTDLEDCYEELEIAEEILAFVDRIKEAWDAADFTEIGNILGEKLAEALYSIPWDEIQAAAQKLAKSLATLINGFVEAEGIGDAIGYTVAQALNTAMIGIDTFLTETHWDSIGTFIADGINSAVKNFNWSLLGKTIADYINSKWELVKSLTASLDFSGLGSSIATAINKALSGINWSTAITAAENIGTGIAEFLNNSLTVETFSNVGKTLANVLNTVFSGISSFLDNADFKEIAESVAAGISAFLQTTDFRGIGKSIAGLVQKGITFVTNTISDLKISDLANALTDLIAGIFSSMDLELDTSNILSSIEKSLQDICKKIKGLTGVELAIGAIITFLGGANPVGIALLASGAASLVSAAASNWGDIGNEISKVVTAIEKVVGSALLALGAVLTFSGGTHVALGIGLLAAGAITLASSIREDWDGVSSSVQKVISTITTIVSVALLAIGAVLTFSAGHIPLGIGLMAAGAVSLASSVAISWGSVSDEIRHVVTTIVGIVSAALLAVGAVLTFSAGQIPLGIGLMAAGAVGLAGTIAANWNSISDKVEHVLTVIAGIVGAASLALGAVLVFTGAGIPLGLGLMVAGAAGLGTSLQANWGSVIGDISGTLSDVKETFLTWLEGVKKNAKDAIQIGVSLIKKGWNTLTEWLSSLGSDIVGGIQAGVSLVKNKWNTVKEWFSNLGSDVTEDGENGKVLVNLLKNKWNTVKEWFSGLGSDVTEDGEDGKVLINLFKNKWNTVKEWFKGLGSDTTEDNENGKVGVNLVKNKWNTVKEWFAGLGKKTTVDDDCGTVYVDLLKKGWDTVKDWFAGLGASITDGDTVINVALKKASQWASEAWQVIQSGGATLISTVSTIVKKSSTWVSDAWSAIKSGGQELVTTVKTKLIESTSNWSEKAWSVIDSAKNGVQNVVETGVELVQSGWNTVKGWFSKWFGSDDESETLTVGVKLSTSASSLWNSLSRDWNGLGNTSVEFTATIKDDSSTWWSNTKSYWKAKVGDVESFTTKVKDDSSTWWSNTKTYWSKVVGAVSDFTTDVKDQSSTWWNHTKQYWSAKVSSVEQFTTNVKDQSSTWWSNTKTYWSNKVGAVSSFTTDVKNQASTWWSNTKTYWSNKVGAVSNFTTDVKNQASTWWSNVKSYWNNYSSSRYVYVSVRGKLDTSTNWWSSLNTQIANKVGTVKVSVSGTTNKASGGIFKNGAWSSIPQFATGTINTGSLFIAGEAGAELVGHINGQTEVLNESQLAAVMKSSIIGGISALLPSLQAIYSQMAVCANGVIGAELISADTFAELENQQANLCKPDMGSGYGFTTAEKNQMEQKLDDKTDRMLLLLSQIANGLDEGLEVDVELDGDSNRIFRVVQDEARAYKKRTGNTAFAI